MNTCVLTINDDQQEVNPNIIQIVEDKVKKTIKKYKLITPKDKVLVALSGGKDSTTCLHILKKMGYNVEAFTVDVNIGCYTQENLANVKKLCKKEKVKLRVISFRKSYGHSVCHARTLLNKKGLNFNSCTVCGVMRRKLFNIAAKEANATKVVTGHNMDDEVQSILMNTFKNRQSLNARISPLQNKISDELVPRIKPLFFVTEDEIIQYSKAMKFPVHYGRCPCSTTSMRHSIREFLKDCKKINPQVVENIMAFFLNSKKTLTKNSNKKKLSKCINCGQPAITSVCRTCQILGHIKAGTQIN